MIKIKWVKRAHQWCKTTISENKGKIIQTQEWASSKKELEEKDV